jgi:hypothetical protein
LAASTKNEAQVETDHDNFDGTGEKKILDCGRFLGELMLRSALCKDTTVLPLGLNILVAPTVDWLPALRPALEDIYCGGRNRSRNNVEHSRIRLIELAENCDARLSARISAISSRVSSLAAHISDQPAWAMRLTLDPRSEADEWCREGGYGGVG